MTQRESVGGIQIRMAEVRDLGQNLGCDGAEGGSKVVNSLCPNTIYNSKKTLEGVEREVCKNLSFACFCLNVTTSPQKHRGRNSGGLHCEYIYVLIIAQMGVLSME